MENDAKYNHNVVGVISEHF